MARSSLFKARLHTEKKDKKRPESRSLFAIFSIYLLKGGGPILCPLFRAMTSLK